MKMALVLQYDGKMYEGGKINRMTQEAEQELEELRRLARISFSVYRFGLSEVPFDGIPQQAQMDWLAAVKVIKEEVEKKYVDAGEQKAQEYERQIQNRAEAINRYLGGIIQDVRRERDEQIEVVHRRDEEIDRLKKEYAENTGRFLKKIETLARLVGERDVVIAEHVRIIEELNASLRNFKQLVDKDDEQVRASGRDGLSKSCEHSCVKNMVFGSSASDEPMSKTNLNSEAAANGEVVVPPGFIELPYSDSASHYVRTADIGYVRHGENNKTLICSKTGGSFYTNLSPQEVLRTIAAEEPDETVQSLKDRLYVYENTPFANWVERAEKAEAELEKIKGYIKGMGMTAKRTDRHGNTPPNFFCVNCGGLLEYSTPYDAYYCVFCNQWTEAKCKDPDCGFCSKRPEKPI